MNVHEMTVEQYHEWLALVPDRRGYQRSIGGSQVGALLGMNAYKTPAHVYDELLELKAPMEESENTERGHLMEPVIRELYARRTKRPLAEGGCKYLMHEGVPFRALLDAKILPLFVGGTSGGLEIKCHGEYQFDLLLTTGIDPSYYAQLQQYLHIWGFKWGAFAAFCPERWQLEHFDVEYDEEFVKQSLLPQAVDFWKNHILTRIRPETKPTTELPKQAIRLGATELERTDEKWARLVEQAKRQKEAVVIATAALEATKEAMKAEMTESDAEVIRCNGTKIAWRETTTRTVKRELLVEAGIDPAPFTVTTASRAFTMNFGRGR